jgi:hypothetical protein
MSTPTATTWWVEVFLGETDGVASASARLHAGGRSTLAGRGTASLSEQDQQAPEVGFEIATARALVELGHHLFEAAADDLSGISGHEVSASELEATRKP